MNHVYLPSTGAHEWQWLLANPALEVGALRNGVR